MNYGLREVDNEGRLGRTNPLTNEVEVWYVPLEGDRAWYRCVNCGEALHDPRQYSNECDC